MSKKISVIILIIIIALVLSGGVYYYLNYYQKKPSPGEETGGAVLTPGVSEFGSGLEVGEDIGEGTVNPLENMPSTNPLENVANPFKESYKNPFTQ